MSPLNRKKSAKRSEPSKLVTTSTEDQLGESVKNLSFREKATPTHSKPEQDESSESESEEIYGMRIHSYKEAALHQSLMEVEYKRHLDAPTLAFLDASQRKIVFLVKEFMNHLIANLHVLKIAAVSPLKAGDPGVYVISRGESHALSKIPNLLDGYATILKSVKGCEPTLKDDLIKVAEFYKVAQKNYINIIYDVSKMMRSSGIRKPKQGAHYLIAFKECEGLVLALTSDDIVGNGETSTTHLSNFSNRLLDVTNFISQKLRQVEKQHNIQAVYQDEIDDEDPKAHPSHPGSSFAEAEAGGIHTWIQELQAGHWRI